MTVRLTLIGKPDCHLCDDAREAVERVMARLSGAERPVDVELVELSILDDEALAREHGEYIPVLQIDGRRHAIWRVDEQKLSAAIEKAARPGLLARLSGRG